jgi:Telomere resolvase
MDKLIKTLQKIDTNKVAEEVKANGPGQSQYLYDAILKAYPKQTEQTIRRIFIEVWSGTMLRNRTTDPNKFTILFQETTKIIQALYPNQNSSEMFFTKLRKSIIDRFGDGSQIYRLSIKNMGLSPAERTERGKNYIAQVAERNEKRGEMEPIYVDDILKTIAIYKTDRDPFKRAMAVLIATGMRGTELFKVSTIKKINDSEIEILQLAKSRPGKKSVRPLIEMEADEVVSSVKFIRDNLNTSGTNEQVEARLNPRLNKVFKDIINMTSHKARYIYANVAYKLFAESKKIPYESYLGKILSHESAQSTKSYLAINLEEGESKESVRGSTSGLDQFKNIMRRGIPESEKTANIVGALKYMKENKIYMSQKGLRLELGYSAAVMTKGYQGARALGVI